MSRNPVCFAVLFGLAGSFFGTPATTFAEEAEGFRPLISRMLSGTVGRFLVLRSELNVTAEQRARVRETLLAHRSEIGKAAGDIMTQRAVR